MTISSELLLPSTNAAAQGSGRNSASSDITGSQATDNSSAENSTSGFKKLLAQEQIAQTTAKPKNSDDTQKSVPVITKEAVDSELVGNIISEPVLTTNGEQPPVQVPETGETNETNSLAAVENQPAKSGSPQPKQEALLTNITVAQNENKAETPTNEKPLSNSAQPQKVISPDGNTDEQVKQVQKAPLEYKNVNSSESRTTEQQTVQNMTRTDTPASENIKPESSQAQIQVIPTKDTDKTESINITPDVAKTANTLSQPSLDQKTPDAEKVAPQTTMAQTDVPSAPADEKAAPQNNSIIQDDVKNAEVLKAGVNITEVNKTIKPEVSTETLQVPVQQAVTGAEMPERQSVTPQQQMAAATAQPAPLKDAENSKAEKDSAKEFAVKKSDAKDSGKGKNAAAAGKEETAGATQSKASASASTPQNILPAKVPFLTELGQAMAGAEGKPNNSGALQLPTGLLALQEVGQNSLQANGLTAPSQVKAPMPPVNPQMVTKQISMAIMKQTGNGQDSFKISLKPADLGQVDIRMDFQIDGRMTATVTVENERTLTLLQKDQAALEKALENAGFNADGNNLNFSLKKQQQNQDNSEFANNDSENGEEDDMSALPGSIISHQQMKMAYSDNVLDINI